MIPNAFYTFKKEALDDSLATKMDIARIEAEIKLLKWMMGFVLAGIAALILKAFF